MIDRGQVDLKTDRSGVTEENAIEAALDDIKNKEQKEKDMRAFNVEYEFTDEDYQELTYQDDFFEGEESEEESSSEEMSSYSKTPNDSERESIVRSNDIALGFDEEGSDSNISEERDESHQLREDASLSKNTYYKSKQLVSHPI